MMAPWIDEVRRLGPPVVVGAVGSVATVLGALAPWSPAVHHTERAWFIGVPWPPFSREVSTLVAAGLFYAGVILMIRGWLAVMRRSSDAHISPAGVAAIAALWAIPLIIGPPLLTRDPFSYAAQGEIFSQGFDPYHHSPEVLGHGDFYRSVDPLWRTTAAPYGPLFLLIARSATRLAGHRLFLSIVLLKLACVAGMALIATYLPRLAKASGKDPTAAVAFVLLNPITLLHLIGGAHNEAIMIGLLVMGLALALEERPLAGIALCVLAGAVKLPAMAGAVFVAWHWASAQAGITARLRRIGLGAAVAGATLVGLTLVAGTSWGWITLVTTPTRVQSYLSPVTTTGIGIGATLGLAGVPHDVFLLAWQLSFIGIALFLATRALIRVRRDGLARATGSALLAVAVLSPVLFPFYLLWGLVPLAAAGFRHLKPLAIVASIGLSLALLPGGRDLLDAVVALGPWWAAGAVAGLFALSVPTQPLLRSRSTLSPT